MTALLVAGCAHQAPPPADTGAAQQIDLPGWSDQTLPGKRATAYSLSAQGGRSCVLARAEQSASLWRRRLQLAPESLAQVEFSWWLMRAEPRATVTQSDRDDAPARLVLAFDGDRQRLSLRNRALFEMMETLTGEAPPYATLMYVWDSHAEPGSMVVSVHSDRVRKIVVGSGDGQQGRWLDFRRDVVADYRRAFGEPPGALVGAAFMTDADNTRSRKTACYGDLVFRAPDASLLPGSLQLPQGNKPASAS
ncbi:DUF3047 domain-containing protein [Roseateles sp. DAIF2]|uniref:DUF3047 domain-containing protein n=1 Tax=Roseateles sp. DAIF2 TaxID=2714952 RepID=UPI0018A2915D|nr:DUF3047 domain-containing protein [Roseateles sp. DAIF2]QPF72525.1 DUF3047 domain-containing protein [Roseateles sp. DAIF2]